MSEPEEKLPNTDNVRLEHKFNYVGGPYAYKNSSKTGKRLDPQNLQELVLMIKPGAASKVRIALPVEDLRAGAFPQHNTSFYEPAQEVDEYEESLDNDPQDFQESLELIPARYLTPYSNLTDLANLKEEGFQRRICSMTQSRLKAIRAQFMHLSDFAFNQMLDIPRPDKRDFIVWYKVLANAGQVIMAYAGEKTKKTNFIQVIQYDSKRNIRGIKHCLYDNGIPLVINETIVDKYRNLRQIAHLGAKGGSEYLNAVERFDDGTVSWIITHKKEFGAAVLKTNGQIVFVANKQNEAAEIAARNLGAEAVINGKWSGNFSIEACGTEVDPLQETFKNKVREQIGNIVDGASIPGLEPVFWI